jgi:nucleotide-binding universal stress UspA family protein
MEQIKKKVMDYLKKTGENLKSKGATVKIKVRTGSPADEIIEVADEINANLIAMSTHGRSGISRWAFGSVTDRALRGGTKPMLLVRAPKEAQKT